MKIFLSVAYTSQLNAQGQVNREYRRFLEQVIKPIEKAGHQVRCAPREDNWRIGGITPAQGVKSDLSNIDRSEVFVALLAENASSGIQFETGYAVAKGKSVLLCAPHATPISFVNQGMVNAGLAKFLTYHSPEALSEGILEHIKSVLP